MADAPLASQITSIADLPTVPARNSPSVTAAALPATEHKALGPRSDDQQPVLVTQAEPIEVGGAYSEKLTLQQLQSSALASNPALAQGNALVQAARGNAFQVGRKANPKLGVDLQQMLSDGQAEQYGLAYEQLFIRRQKLQLNQAVASKEAWRLQQRLATIQRQLLTEVHRAFLRALRAEEQIEVAKALVDINREALTLVSGLYSADQIAQTDVFQAEIEVSAAEMRFREAQSAHRAAWRGLSTLIGQPTLPLQSLDGDLFDIGDPILYDEVLSVLQTQSPEIGVLLAKIERQKCNLARQQVEPKPDVAVRGLFNVRDNGADGEPNVGLFVAVPWAVHDKNEGAIQEARYQLIAANRELEQLRISLGTRLAPIYGQYAASRERAVALSENMIPKAERTLQLVAQTYEVGATSFATLLTSQRTYSKLRFEYVDSLESLQQARAQIEGFLLSNVMYDAEGDN